MEATLPLAARRRRADELSRSSPGTRAARESRSAAPVLPTDPVRHLALIVEVEARDVTHHSALSLHDLVRRAF